MAVTGWGGGRGGRCGGREEEREFVEYQYLKSGTVKTLDLFVRMLNLAALADDIAMLCPHFQNVQPVSSRCQQQQAVPKSPCFCKAFIGFDGSLQNSETSIFFPLVKFKSTERPTQDTREGGSRERMKLNIVSENGGKGLERVF